MAGQALPDGIGSTRELSLDIFKLSLYNNFYNLNIEGRQ
jgi:hypothetical protein